jgi:hypothetical protein
MREGEGETEGGGGRREKGRERKGSPPHYTFPYYAEFVYTTKRQHS